MPLFWLSLAVVLHDYNAVLYDKNVKLPSYTLFYGGIVVCAYPIFCFLCSCWLLFFTAAHFHLAGRKHFSFSHRLFEFPCFSSYEFVFLFSITRSSSFSVIHVSVNIKNNAEKDTTLLLFFLSKSPGGHAISFQIKP